MRKRIRITVNGREREADVDTRKLLVDVLREDLRLTGTHFGCGTGNCGACTVMLEGRCVKSCCVLAVEADGAELLTIEGVGDGSPHPVQEALADNHGVQCGYCTPGVVLSAIELLDGNAAPSDAEIRQALAGNLCRCTGYVNIVGAVRLAAARMAGGER